MTKNKHKTINNSRIITKLKITIICFCFLHGCFFSSQSFSFNKCKQHFFVKVDDLSLNRENHVKYVITKHANFTEGRHSKRETHVDSTTILLLSARLREVIYKLNSYIRIMPFKRYIMIHRLLCTVELLKFCC